MQGQVVGMVATTPSVDLQLLQANFKLEEGLPAGCCDTPAAHAELDVCIVNPVFGKCVGALLAGELVVADVAGADGVCARHLYILAHAHLVFKLGQLHGK